MSEELSYSGIETVYGEINVVWREAAYLKVQRVILPHLVHTLEEEFTRVKKSLNPTISHLLDNIALFLEGEDVSFDLELVDFGLCSDFQQKVLLAEYGIPRGSISTYSRIARHIGKPLAARAVGNALASNPFPLIIPCHRAIRSDGSLGGYQGGLEMKKRLLEMEGVRIHNNRVDMKKMFY